jgi:protein-tyrosine phosphatase
VSVLVVCTANIARSPLAAAMLAASLDGSGLTVASAGTEALPGYPAAEASQRLAAVRGLDLRGHRSRPVTDELIRDADLVLTMSERHRDRCAPLAAGAGARVFTLRELVRLLGAVERGPALLEVPPDDPAERLAWMVERAHLARPAALPAKRREDVRDPIRAPWPAWLEMGATLDGLLARVVDALGSEPGWQLPQPPDPAAGDLAGGVERVGAGDAGVSSRGARTTGLPPARRWWRRRR